MGEDGQGGDAEEVSVGTDVFGISGNTEGGDGGCRLLFCRRLAERSVFYIKFMDMPVLDNFGEQPSMCREEEIKL